MTSRRVKREPSSTMLRVRLNPSEHAQLVAAAEYHSMGVSDYVRVACEKYHDVSKLLALLEQEAGRRQLTTPECNVMLLLEPDVFVQMGGVELAKPPAERVLFE
jgi:hypothetical protein